MSVAGVIARRRRERASLVEVARGFAGALDAALGARAVVVFGSVARGDFHPGSDVDVLVVADGLPEHPLDRVQALGAVPPPVEVVSWTCQDWTRAEKTGNPIWAEALARGIWLVGSPGILDAPARGQRDPDA
ncbi:MAG: nucleotidyltransferase domain-containing protein [Acidimicrobiales bacterium]